MTLKTVTKIYTQSSDINKLQDNIAAAVDPLATKVQNDSQLLTNIVLSQGKINNVPHLLNRVASGSIVIYKTAQSDIWNAQASDGSFLYLMCSADCTISLEVF